MPKYLDGIEILALGRQFNIGTLYNYVDDIIIPNIRLWDPFDVSSLAEVETKENAEVLIKTIQQTDKEDESLEEREDQTPFLSNLGMDDHTAMSLMAGLLRPSLKGAWQYAADWVDTKNELFRRGAHVAVHCCYSEKNISIDPESELDIVCRLERLMQIQATHVVVAITYGLEAFCIFPQGHQAETYARIFKDELVNESETLERDRDEEGDEEDGGHCSIPKDLQCILYSDLMDVENGKRWTLKPAAEQYEACRKILGHGTEKPIPLRVWLYPLNKLLAVKERIAKMPPNVKDVSQELLFRCQAILSHFHGICFEAELLANELDRLESQQSIPSTASQRIKHFKELVMQFLPIFIKALSVWTAKIRQGTAGEEKISNTIDAMETQTPFVPEKLKQWLNLQRQELKTLKSLDKLPGVLVVSSMERLEQEIKNGGSGSYAVVLHLPSPRDELNSLVNETSRFIVEFNDAESSSWMNLTMGGSNPKTTAKARSSIYRQMFTSGQEFSNWITNHNSDTKNVRYIIFYDECTERALAFTRLYQCGMEEALPLLDFTIPEAPGQVTVTKNCRGVIGLSWTAGEITGLRHYLIQYRSVNGQEEHWHPVRKSANTIEIDYLQSGEIYVFRVAAETLGGRGPFSPVSYEVTIDPVCPPPTELRANEVTDTSISISWHHQPYFDNDDEDGYCYNEDGEYDDYDEEQREYDDYDEEQREYDDYVEEQREYDDYEEEQREYDDYEEEQREYDDYEEEQREYDDYEEEQREYDDYVEEQREYDDYEEEQREYDDYDEEQREYDDYDEEQREYDNYDEEQREYDDYVEEQREYDDYEEEQREYDDYVEEQREYDDYEEEEREYCEYNDNSNQEVSIVSFSVECWMGDSRHESTFIQRSTTDKSIVLEPLIPGATYYVQVRVECKNASGSTFFSPSSEVLQTCTLEDAERTAVVVRRTSKKCSALPGIDVYELPLKKRCNSKIQGVGHYVFGEPSYLALFGNRRQRTILVLGATGSGKSTLINAMVNYVLGVEWEDDFRFKLINEPTDKSQAYSQTDLVTTYDFYEMKGSRLDYSLTIVDTPGFGDTRGMEKDKKIMQQLKDYFQSPHGIQQLEAVCFVIQSSLARLTPTQQYIFDQILSIFGENIKDNIRLMVTFADNDLPPVLNAVKKANIPSPTDPTTGLPLHHKFNNSIFFETNKSSRQVNEFNRTYFELAVKGFDKFFADLMNMEAKSLTLTREVLEERRRLEALVEGLQLRTQIKLARIDEFEQIKKMLAENQQQMDENKNFDFEVEFLVPKSTDISGTGQFTTNCQKCTTTCHFPCSKASDTDKHRCSVMDSNGTCRICKCPWNVHFNQKFRYEMVKEKVQRSSDAIRKQYQGAKSKALTNQELLAKIQAEIDQYEKQLMELVQETSPCIQRLNEIALKPHTFSTPAYIDLLIKTEKQEHRPGYQDRITMLQRLQQVAEMMTKLVNDHQIPKTQPATSQSMQTGRRTLSFFFKSRQKF